MKLFDNGMRRHLVGRWLQAIALSLPLLVVQVAVSQLATDAGIAAPGVAQAREDAKKKNTQETRRTPALRNKV